MKRNLPKVNIKLRKAAEQLAALRTPQREPCWPV
jgi:hypothetical protein